MIKIINKYYEPELKQVRVVILEDELNDYMDKLREECKYWKEQYLTANELSVEVSEFIEKNFTNSDGTIWHEDMKKIYNILGWGEDDENS